MSEALNLDLLFKAAKRLVTNDLSLFNVNAGERCVTAKLAAYLHEYVVEWKADFRVDTEYPVRFQFQKRTLYPDLTIHRSASDDVHALIEVKIGEAVRRDRVEKDINSLLSYWWDSPQAVHHTFFMRIRQYRGGLQVDITLFEEGKTLDGGLQKIEVLTLSRRLLHRKGRIVASRIFNDEAWSGTMASIFRSALAKR